MISCASGCGRQAESPEQAGWDYLQITGRWRCGACGLELRLAGAMVGAAGGSGDPLSPSSIGALKKLPEPIELHEKVRP